MVLVPAVGKACGWSSLKLAHGEKGREFRSQRYVALSIFLGSATKAVEIPGKLFVSSSQSLPSALCF